MKQTLVFHASDRHFGNECYGLSREWGFELAKVAAFDLTQEAVKFASSIFNRTEEEAVLIRFGGRFDGFGRGTLVYRDRNEDIGEAHMKLARIPNNRNDILEAMRQFMEREDLMGLTAIPMGGDDFQFVWFK